MSNLINETINNMSDVKGIRNVIINISNNTFKDQNSFLFFLIAILIISLIIMYKPWKKIF